MRLGILAAGLALVAGPVLAGTWANGGNTAQDRRASLETTISVANVATLTPAWVATMAGDVSATPTIVGDAVFVTDWGGYVYRLSAATGAVVWKVKLADITGRAASFSRNSPAVGPKTVILGDQAAGALVALDRGTGKLVWQTLVDAHPEAIITASPVIAGGKIFVGVASNEELATANPAYVPSFRGSVAAVDLASGTVLWRFMTAPVGYTGAAVWGTTPAVDTAHGLVYVGTGNNYTVPAAVARCLNAAPATPDLCLAGNDWVDAVLALDTATGALVWGHRVQGPDAWNVNCVFGRPACVAPVGPDYDFGSGANLYAVGPDATHTAGRRFVGIGQKSGVYRAFNPDDGTLLWATQVGPGSKFGGIQWGTATDSLRIYVPICNDDRKPYALPNGTVVSAGSWAGLDARRGHILWQVPATGVDANGLPARAFAPVSVTNGVMFGGSSSGDMVALDAATGATLWRFAAGATVAGGPAIAGGTVVWGSGYSHFGIGTPGTKLYGFRLK